ncbi:MULTISPECIES: PPOX class F420-dependent oxidoreductase [unclassified Rhodococcus (in: high G+C Gram-positive bacteria)]|jgi:PPOX class probable F420-dependent enzyme|uniref:PPOX class F420-dependent oxidoreductase n=1 Tax=unclassified Rhodococcus (in: high G+C Gram-positive bacteria) TaxID=192944 RepID=UPI001C9AE8F5|nr:MULTISPECIES: PPOX class F420-dependent oxidoreductase [unclassified Rhodococcus (in: high G+C Gram-positive bacteria)]MBY6675413.1 PPOX class F420-dependent oxidoreductase [Rhodococcus sp. BP-332]MDQ1201782.1 PPOX class probable F420-dependent enzyme [Rhodococcus sp. SORGH_AS_0303]
MSNPFGDVGTAKYVLLTTFTKDGTPKPTPIWAALDGDRLLMWTQRESWKVKRIRNTPRVTVATCDRSGKNVGPAMDAVAEVLDDAGTARTRDVVIEKYGITGRIAVTMSSLFKGKSSTVGLALRAA